MGRSAIELVDTGRHQAEGRAHLPVRRSSTSASFRPRSQEYRQSPVSAVTFIPDRLREGQKQTLGGSHALAGRYRHGTPPRYAKIEFAADVENVRLSGADRKRLAPDRN